MNIKLILFILFLGNTCFAQNLSNKQGLRFGLWRHENKEYTGRIDEGSYVIVPFTKVDTIKCWLRDHNGDSISQGYCDVKYKGKEELLFLNGAVDDSVSVQNGLWVSTDTSGSREEKFYDQGVQLWSKKYGSKGELQEYHYKNVDSTLDLIYRLGRIFKKEIYLQNQTSSIIIYYPNDDLIISNAELKFRCNFINKPTDTTIISLSAKKELTITNITSEHFKFFTIERKTTTFPIKISSRPTQLIIVSAPIPANFEYKQKFTITTKEAPYEYEIDADIISAHIDYSTVEHIDTLALSKSQDRYLWIEKNGSVNDINIIDESNIRHEFNLWKGHIIGIELDSFSVGIYRMEAFMEDLGNPNIVLIIKE